MKQEKHTPGPWRLGNPGQVYTNDLMRHICDCRTERYMDSEVAENNQANARLIAAAPSLLMACQDALSYVEDGCTMEAAEILRDVIAKARG